EQRVLDPVGAVLGLLFEAERELAAAEVIHGGVRERGLAFEVGSGDRSEKADRTAHAGRDAGRVDVLGTTVSRERRVQRHRLAEIAPGAHAPAGIGRLPALERAQHGEPPTAAVVGKARAVALAMAKVQVDARRVAEREAGGSGEALVVEGSADRVRAVAQARGTERKARDARSAGDARLHPAVIVTAHAGTQLAGQLAGACRPRDDVDHAAPRAGAVA